ncbi:hypothetical protein RHA1_ro08376 (plasmid) [Rhodococcus jostii RHA1]|uniref:Uncharacterized protein n=1 Tax=Rhodococcus jostii (strain RHA1) TaxID=101510 RepID=Q0RZ66_RHOJR|nr:hypothetical protein RHA1_ro08376 [Rhodococcus jostii RHA1]
MTAASCFLLESLAPHRVPESRYLYRLGTGFGGRPQQGRVTLCALLQVLIDVVDGPCRFAASRLFRCRAVGTGRTQCRRGLDKRDGVGESIHPGRTGERMSHRPGSIHSTQPNRPSRCLRGSETELNCVAARGSGHSSEGGLGVESVSCWRTRSRRIHQSGIRRAALQPDRGHPSADLDDLKRSRLDPRPPTRSGVTGQVRCGCSIPVVGPG